MNFKKIDKNQFDLLIKEMREIQNIFFKDFGIDDLWSNSKFTEVIIANALDHEMIPGHSGSRDAKNKEGDIFEYKHYKKNSSNHSWTFNDFSDSTIKKLKTTDSVVFAHLNDDNFPPKFDWYMQVPGKKISDYLSIYTKNIKNNRKMINVSPGQLKERLKINKTNTKINNDKSGKYLKHLNMIFNFSKKLERLTGVKNLLTSNKIWEQIVAIKLNHNINSEQGGRAGSHDAFDEKGNEYEYKVYAGKSWGFQDISDEVLKKYEKIQSFILATVDKKKIVVKNIFEVKPLLAIPILKKKRDDKIKKKGSVRRFNESLSIKDIKKINAKKIL